MVVSDWMTKSLVTVSPDRSISDAISLMKERKIKHIPVTRNEALEGLISDRDIKEFTPSKATTLDVYELNYLLQKFTVGEVMTRKVMTTAPDAPIEQAAMIMLDRDIGCLPVVSAGKLVGIISDKDIFRALVDITGIRHGGSRFSMTIEDTPGSIKDVADVIREYGFTLQSILTSYEGVDSGYRYIVIRAAGKENVVKLQEKLAAKYKDLKVS